MEKEFMPYSLALRMKELNFNEPCLKMAMSEIDIINAERTDEGDYPKNSDLYSGWVSIPTYSQAFRWFREKNFHVNIDSYHCLGKAKPFGLSIDYLHKSGKWDYVDYRDDEDFETYEEAQKRAAEVIIEILENE